MPRCVLLSLLLLTGCAGQVPAAQPEAAQAPQGPEAEDTDE